MTDTEQKIKELDEARETLIKESLEEKMFIISDYEPRAIVSFRLEDDVDAGLCNEEYKKQWAAYREGKIPCKIVVTVRPTEGSSVIELTDKDLDKIFQSKRLLECNLLPKERELRKQRHLLRVLSRAERAAKQEETSFDEGFSFIAEDCSHGF